MTPRARRYPPASLVRLRLDPEPVPSNAELLALGAERVADVIYDRSLQDFDALAAVGIWAQHNPRLVLDAMQGRGLWKRDRDHIARKNRLSTIRSEG